MNRLHQGQLEFCSAALEKAIKDLKQFEDNDVGEEGTVEPDLLYMYTWLRAIKSVACDHLRYTKQGQFRKCSNDYDRDKKIARRRDKYMREIEDRRRKAALIDSGDWYQPDDSSTDTDCSVEYHFQGDMEHYRRCRRGQ